ncbi:hypothetical protein [Pedobacter metabolipauper]|uniref:Uncharacterized protein n=1 Tax=Pedobacter metabolipauper TaxID=425513 RepID=A0A4R6SWA6_9SPHI|nr:hypothetical protein [Pedobacter metabolipauper]TDQ09691.1 hypothetical protein ATK78_1848 [Pedobacter metabolipauper]
MNKIFSCIIILFLSSNIKAQQFTAVIENKEKTTTLFDYGQPLNTTESNFKNLFENFPLFVSNSGEDLKLISYKYITAIKNEKQIKLYVKKNTEVYDCDGGIMSVLASNDIENNRIKLEFPYENQTNKKIDKFFLKETHDNMEKMTKNINPGDEVYVVKFIANGIKYDFYIFVNPKTKIVLKEGNFLGFSIPLYYADFYSKRKTD